MHFHSPWSPDADCEPLGGGGAGADGVRPEPLGLEHGEELVTRAQGPGVSAISHQQQPQGAEVEVAVVLGGQEAPVQVPGLADGDTRPVLRDHLHPGGGVNLQHKIVFHFILFWYNTLIEM